MAVINTNLHQSSSFAPSTKTPYQQLFTQPVQQEWKLGDKPNNYGQALATINAMYKTNPTGAMEKLNQLNQYRTQPGNKWFDPYSVATNNVVNELKTYGIDPAELTDDWFKANTSWQGYLSYNGTTTTPSKPGKKASAQEKAAYALYQFQNSMGATSAAKNEWAAAQDEIAYWANRKDLNLSDDDIIQKVLGSNKYSTLKKMDDSRTTGKPLELNEAIDYNPDSVRGVLWAARNGGGTGNSRQDIANYYSKVGNGWIANEDISAKLNKANLATYSPHEIGMTGKDMDDVGAYFGVGSFAPGEIEAMRSKVDWDDATSVKMWQKGYDSEQTTLKAEEELAEFNRQFERRLNRGFKDQNAADKWIEDQLNSGDFNTLAKMDSGIQKGEPINMTRAVPYRKQMYQNLAAEAIANPKKSGSEIMESYGMPVSEADKATTKVENENVGSALDAMGSFLSKGEKDYFDAVPGVDYARITAGLSGVAEGMKSGVIDITNNATQYAEEANGKYNKTWLGSLASRNEYERYQTIANRLSTEVEDFEAKNGTQILASESIESEPIFSLDDGTQVQLIYDDETGEYEIGNVWNDMWRFNQPSPELLTAANEKAEQLRIEQNNRAGGIRTAQAEAGDMDADTVKGVEEYNKKKEQLAAINEYLDANKAGYEQSVRDADETKANRDALGEIAAKALGVAYDPSTADSIMQYAGGWYDYVSPPVDGITLVEESAGKTADEINAEIADNNANIQDLRFVLSMLGDNVPEDLKWQIDKAISDAEKQNSVYGDYMITKDPRFDYLARKGQESLHYDEHNEPQEGISKIWFPIMTDEEKKIYFALVNRDGIEKADQFYKNIQGELEQRRKNQIEGDAQRMAESGWLGRIASEVGVVLVDEINTLAGAAYTAGVFFGGDEGELSALKIISHVSQSVHNANIAEIKKVYGDPETGEETALSKAISTIYEIGYNRGRSMVNAGTWGMLMPQVSGTGAIANFVNSVLSATPIALSAASDALKNAIDQNATPEQQAIIFASTLIAESWTEAIEFGHIEKAGKLLMTKEGFMQFLKAYPFEALSEVAGETLNDVIENEAGNHWAKMIENLDYESEHEAAMRKYMAEDDTLTPEQAEAMVYQDEIAGVLHTAVISALSPTADVLAMAGNTIKTYNQYAQEAKAYNNGLQPQVRQTLGKSIRDIRLEHEAAEEAKNNPQPVATETVSETTSQATQPEAEAPVNEYETYAAQMDTYDANIILLEEASNANATAQAAAIASVINTGNTYAAQAAAAKLDFFTTQGVMIAGRSLGIDPQIISTGLQLGALGNGACAELLNTGIENGLGTFGIAEGLVSAVNADMQNETVAQSVAAGIHDARVDEEMKRLMAGLKTTSESTPTNAGEAMERLSEKTAVDAMEAVDNARNETKTAEAVLEIKQNELAVAQQGVSDAAAAVANDPVNDGNQMTAALSKMVAASAVVQEYTQKLDKARENQRAVEDKNMKLIEETTASLRQEAENTVSQQEAVEAEQARVEAEARAAAEAEQRETNNASAAMAEQFTNEMYPNASPEDRERISSMVANAVANAKQTGMVDQIRSRKNFADAVAKKFGLNIRYEDTTKNGTTSRKNAYVDMNSGDIVIDERATQDDIMYAVLTHELTHIAEKSGTYTDLANAVLQMVYNDPNISYSDIISQMNAGTLDSQIAADLRAKKQTYDSTLGRNHSYESILQELVADGMGTILSGDQNLIQRFAAEKPSVARRVLDSIKSFLKKMVGIEGAPITQAQRVVDMLEAALNEGTQKLGADNQTKASLPAVPIAESDDGTPLAEELPGGTVAINELKYSLSSFDAKERDRVRQALYAAKDENGGKRFTKTEVDKYIYDAMSIAAMIANDRARLDFIVSDPSKSMMKPNSDYGGSIDASTLCAKRLVYQGTFDAISHLLPNTPLMPEDLIHISDVMREMGYETPCGLCYVESRRKNLDDYIAKWLNNYQGEYVPRIDEVSTTDGLEEIRKNHPKTYEDFQKAMNAFGQQNNPKPVQLRTEYRGEIRSLDDDKIQEYINHGGIRLQSFSDFETPHLLDMIQVVLDMSAKGLTAQAYTKVPNFAWVFGDTGIKINLSLIGKDGGVDENGNLIFDDVEGMNHEEAFRIRERYGYNVGTILVGMNDKHILAAMADPRIDYIIPFHRSGWKNSEMKLMHTLDGYENYQIYQTEKDIDTGAKTKKNKGNNIRPLGTKDDYGNGYWDFDKTGKENAEKYLELCYKNGLIPVFPQFLVKGDDGHYYLQPDGSTDGYWKLLIDVKMYDNEGKGAPQRRVTPNVNMPQAYRVIKSYDLSREQPGENTPPVRMKDNNSLPVAQPVVDRIVEELRDRGEIDDRSAIAQNASTPRSMWAAANAMGTPVMDQTFEAEAEDSANSKQNRMAIDAETGETIKYSLVDMIVSSFDGMSDAEVRDILGLNDDNEDDARKVLSVAVKDIKDEFDPTIYNNRLYLKPDTLDHWLSGSGFGSSDPTYSKAYITTMNPSDFLRMTTASESNQQRILNEAKSLNSEQLEDYGKYQPIYLMIDEADSGWKVIGHEGRHRSVALARAGVTEMPVFIVDSSERGKYMKKPHDEVTLEGQNFYDNVNGNTLDLYDLIPVNNVYRDELFQRFTASAEEEANATANNQRILRYSIPSDDILKQQIQGYINQRYSISKPLEGQKGPSSSDAGTAERAFGGGMLQESEMDTFAKEVVREYGRYFPDTNLDQIKRAVLWVRSNKLTKDSDGLIESMQKVSDNKFDYRSADGQARMVALMAIAVAKNDVAAQTVLADAFNRQGTDLGRALQARKLFRMMTPAGRIATIDKMLKDEQARLEQKGIKKELKFSDWVYMAAAAATEEGDFTKVRQMAAEELADQLPANWKDRIRAIRMLSMLGNPRTHIRNIIGNALFVPAVSLKNKMGAAAEMLAGVEQGERTKTIRLRVDKDIREFAEWDAMQHKDDLTGDSRWNERDIVRREQKLFKGKFAWLQSLSDFNSNLLEKEDWKFLKGHYTRALGGWMQANGYTVEQIKSHPELLEKGRAYALNEAQKATYRDFNAVANKLNQLSRQGGPVGFIVDAALPFKKTPANILKRGIEYSPIGLAKSLSADLYNWKKGNLTTNQLIDDICSGLTGTGIMMMGALLSSLGIVTVGMDDDDDRFETERGGQKYSINLGKLFGIKIDGQDVTYTLDWAAPSSMPFFVGAAVWDQKQKERDGYTFEDFLNDSSSIAEPVFQLSMLEGVNSLFENAKSEDTNSITQIGAKILSNYVTSYVPSALGSINRTFFDPVRRKSFVKSGESSGPMGTFRYAWEQAQNKIPGMSNTNIPYRNAFGEAEESGFLERAFENFISPGYVSVTRNDPVIEELERLYDSSDVSDERKTALVPKLPNKAVSGTALEPEQYDAITVQRGQTAKNLMSDLMNTSYYKNASDEDRAIMMADVWTYATQTAQNDTVGRKLDTWVLNSRTNPIQSIINRSKKTIVSETQNGWKAEAVQAVKAGDYDALDVCIEGLKDAGVKDAKSSVKSAISSEYKTQYIMAYQRGDYDAMMEIEDTLENTGLFKQSDFEKWLDTMNAQISDEEI